MMTDDVSQFRKSTLVVNDGGQLGMPAPEVTERAMKPPITSRSSYAGLKALPENAYKKLRVPVEGTDTHVNKF